MKNIFILFGLFLVSFSSIAGEERYMNYINGTDVAVGEVMDLNDAKFYVMQNFPSWQYQFTNHSVKNRVILEFDKNNPQEFLADFTTDVELIIDYIDENLVAHSVTKTLTLEYYVDPSQVIIDRSTFVFEGAHDIKVTISSINSPIGTTPPNLQIRSEILIERYYAFNHNQTASQLSYNYTTGDNHVQIYWNPIDGAEEYDLEWVYVNDYTDQAGIYKSSGTIPFNYYKNSTRITTGKTYYDIPAIFDHGYLIFRLRAVSKHGTDFKNRYDGQWSTSESGTISTHPLAQVVPILSEYEGGIKNWSHSVVYTEGGKRKEQVAFSDGLGRQRQTVSYNPVTDQAIVQNAYYDYHGRVAVTDLPTPVNDGQLAYYQNFNQSSTGVYNAENFDLDYSGPTCPVVNDQMLTSSGAGQYYSVDNPDQEGQQAYVPNAEGYPFIRVEYTPDHTGRISRTSAYGPDFQLDSGHETKYSYSTPTQGELNALFGDEVGDWNKYSKTLTEDANGQVYVSYYDFHGRVIASGLVGPAPLGIESLENNTGPSNYTTTIFEGVTGQDETFGSVELNSSFTVDITGDVSFSYFLNPEIFQDACMSNICFDCVYDLTMQLTTIDECGVEVVVFDETHTINGIPIDGLCNEADEFNLPASSLQATLSSGTYYLHKTLTVNEQAREDYLCLYLENSSCLMSYQDFFNASVESANFDNCIDSSVLPSNSSGSYCGPFESILLMDISPNGQYGLYDNVNGVYSSSAYPLSVFNVSNSLPIANANWTNPATPYMNADGITPSLVGGVAPQNLTLTEFITNWQSSWGASLLPYHPEYAYLQFCSLNSVSHDFNDDLNAESAFSDACASYYLDPLGTLEIDGSIFPQSLSFYNACDESTNSIVTDPFFQSGAFGAPYFSDMRLKMAEYATIDGQVLSIWELAILMAKCPEAQDALSINGCLRDYGGKDDCLEDLIWSNFRTLYLTAKLEFYQLAELDYVMANGSYNGCISEATFVASNNDFDCYPLSQSPICSTNSNNYDGYSDANQACNSTTFAFYANKDRRFPVYDPANFIMLTPAQQTALAAQAQIDMDDLCNETCNENANDWMASLAGCGLSTANYNAIKAEFIELCILGCDFENPMGTSTLPQGVTTTNGNTSFNDALEYHLGANYENEICSDLLISDLRPHGQGPSEQLTTTLDDCGCDMVLQAEYDFNLNPNNYTSIEEAFLLNNGFEADGINTMLCVCSKAFVNEWTPGVTWSQTSLTNIANEDITVPIEFSCEEENCYDCAELSVYVSDFHNRFTNGTQAEIEAFEATPSYGTLLSNYLNNELAFNLGAFDYIEFLEQCNSTIDDMYCTDTPEMLSIVPILDLLVKQDKFLTPTGTPIDMMTENVPYQFTPFGQGMTNHNYWTDYSSTTCTNGTLTMFFGNVADNCNITLALPVGAEFCFDDIIAVNSVTNNSDGCGDNFGFLLNVTYVDCNGLQTGSLTGVSSCYEVSSCHCGPTGLVLCDELIPEVSYDDCYSYQIDVVTSNAMNDYEAYLSEVKDQFREDYTNKCMDAFDTEKLDMSGVKNEYQYTLYYYDQSGNLVRTVAPKGVKESENDPDISTQAGIVPDYKFDTDYRYNSYNQLENSNTPDGGEVNYWYDQNGRIVASQNAVQLALNSYAYSVFDINGRIIEVGQTQQSIGNELTETIAKGNSSNFENWVTQGVQTEITKTFYDEPISATVASLFKSGTQSNLRLRIGTVAYYEAEVNDYTTDYTSAIHYSYDVHGNVIENIQDVPMMAPVNQDIKSTQYSYDLISGNVNEVTYQEDDLDQFVQRYEYDELNRLHESFTSSNNVDYDKESKQFYYDHGPLARVEIGEDKVQACDYTYTINGWLKGVNSSTLKRENDLGLDGITASNSNYGGLHSNVARDVFGYTLGYFERDYLPINGSQNFEAQTFNTPLGNASANLYNGNIRYMTTAIEGYDIQGTSYTYDQLQRFKKMEVYRGVDVVNNTWGTSAYTDDYRTEVWYDENGNIKDLHRNGVGNELDMDRFSYIYNSPTTNQLHSVTDIGTDYSGYDDIKQGMSGNNYQYDAIGRLTQDNSENIGSIEWRNSDNKVKKINRVSTTDDDIEFIYNPFGMRIAKIVKPDLNLPGNWIYTYYTYDASGNSMGTYSSTLQSINKETIIDEHFIYGGKRLGTKNSQILLYNNGVITPVVTDIIENERGLKSYELSNHLGNVLAVVSDRTTYMGTQSGPTDDDYGFVAYIQSKSDYYPFGMQMPGRNYSDGGSYRYGFQGQEKDDEIKGEGKSLNYRYRMHDPRIGRFFAIDPLAALYPYYSPYSFSGNLVIHAVELEGLEPSYVNTSNGGFTLGWIFDDNPRAMGGLQQVQGGNTPTVTTTTGGDSGVINGLNGYGAEQTDVVNYLSVGRWAARQAEINRISTNTQGQVNDRNSQQNKLNAEINTYNTTTDYLRSSYNLTFDNLQKGDQVIITYTYLRNPNNPASAVTVTVDPYTVDSDVNTEFNYTLNLQKGDNGFGEVTSVTYSLVRGTDSNGNTNNSTVSKTSYVKTTYSEAGKIKRSPITKFRSWLRSRNKKVDKPRL